MILLLFVFSKINLNLPFNKVGSELSFFDDIDYWPPLISFHGEQDAVFNYISQDLKFDEDDDGIGDDLHSTTECINSTEFTTDDNPSNTDLETYGSKGIFDTILEQLPPADKPFRELYLDTALGHGYTNFPSPGCFCAYGKTCYTTDDIDDYIIGRSSTFLQAIILGIDSVLKGSSHKKVFENCINNRVANSTNDSYCP